MKCELSEKLIPLYVGGDLEPDESDAVRLHLESCAGCNRLAEDFYSSRNWFAAAPPPDFDEASFANLRASVLSRIQQQPSTQKWFDWLLPKWNPGLVLAASAAALVLISGLLITIYRDQTPSVKNGEEVIADRAVSTTAVSKPNSAHSKQPETKQVIASSQASRRSNRLKVETTSLPPEAFQNDPFGQPLEEQQTIDDPAAVAEAAPTEQKEKDMLRIELQTADPNIRIIWFTPKSDIASNTKTK